MLKSNSVTNVKWPAFPRLMQDKESRVLLISGPGASVDTLMGTVVHEGPLEAGESWGVGYWSDCWNADELSPYSGEVTLKED